MAKHYQSAHIQNNEKLYPDGLDEMIPHLLVDNQISLIAIGLSIRYLEEMMLADSTIPFSCFKPYHGESNDAFLNIRTNMILNSST